MTNFPAPRPVQANGLRLSVHERGEGFPVVLCHGFPELAYSWRHQMDALAEAGFRAIALDMRGCGATESPRDVKLYDIHHLTGDLAGLLEALGLERAVICGHDWGGYVAWSMARAYPRCVAGIIGVNTPDFPRTPVEPIKLMRDTFGERMYWLDFQKPGLAESLFDPDPARTFRFFLRRHRLPPTVLDDPSMRVRFLSLFDAFDKPEEDWAGRPFLKPEEFEVYRRAYAATGFGGAVNWFRNITRNWETTAHWPQRIDVPCLMITAEYDIVLRPSLAAPMGKWIRDLETHLIRGSGHWTQAEQPEELSRLLVDWLTRRFGGA